MASELSLDGFQIGQRCRGTYSAKDSTILLALFTKALYLFRR